MLVRDIEKALLRSDEQTWSYGPPLDRNALIHLCRHIDGNVRAVPGVIGDKRWALSKLQGSIRRGDLA